MAFHMRSRGLCADIRCDVKLMAVPVAERSVFFTFVFDGSDSCESAHVVIVELNRLLLFSPG